MKEINKTVKYSDDDEVVGYYCDDLGFIFPMTKGGLRQVPKGLLKIAITWVLAFSITLFVIIPVAAYFISGEKTFYAIWELYGYVWDLIYLFFKFMWDTMVWFWELLKK